MVLATGGEHAAGGEGLAVGGWEDLVIKKKTKKPAKKLVQPKKRAPAKKAPAKRAVVDADPMLAFLAKGRAVDTGSVTYMLRTCDAQMRAHGGFVWPREGACECPDWKPRSGCGNGLHGLLMGEGDPGLTSSAEDAVWMVCAVWAADVVQIGTNKCKAPRAWVLFCGNRTDAVAELQKLGATKPIYGTSTSGYGGTSTSGDGGTSTSGNRGTSTSGDGGTSTSGDGGTSTSGYGGTSTSGDGGTSTSGNRGTSTSGYGGTSTSGYGGTAQSGEDGVLCILRWNGKRYVPTFAAVGENGIEPNVKYRLDNSGAFVRAADADKKEAP